MTYCSLCKCHQRQSSLADELFGGVPELEAVVVLTGRVFLSGLGQLESLLLLGLDDRPRPSPLIKKFLQPITPVGYFPVHVLDAWSAGKLLHEQEKLTFDAAWNQYNFLLPMFKQVAEELSIVLKERLWDEDGLTMGPQIKLAYALAYIRYRHNEAYERYGLKNIVSAIGMVDEATRNGRTLSSKEKDTINDWLKKLSATQIDHFINVRTKVIIHGPENRYQDLGVLRKALIAYLTNTSYRCKEIAAFFRNS